MNEPLPTILVGPPPDGRSPPLPAERPAPPDPRADARPPVWTAFVLFLLTLAASMVAAIAVIFVLAFVHGARTGGPASPAELAAMLRQPATLLAMLGLSALASAVLALGAAAIAKDRWRALALARPRLGPASVGILCVAAAALGRSAEVLADRLHLESSGPGTMVGELIRTASRAGATSALFLATIAVVAIVAPVAEELVFRGFIQGWLVRRWGRWPGILVTSALFALAHFDRLQSPFALGIGVFLGWVVVRSGSLWPAVLAHASNNLLAVIQLRLEALHPSVMPAILGVSFAALAASVFILRRPAERVSGATAEAPPPATPP